MNAEATGVTRDTVVVDGVGYDTATAGQWLLETAGMIEFGAQPT